MKKTLMTLIFMIVIGYGTEMMPLMNHPFFMTFAHADEGGYKELGDTKNHTMPPSSKVHEKANGSAVEHREAVQEAVENAGTERDDAQGVDLKKGNEEKRESESKLVAGVAEDAHKTLRVVEDKISEADAAHDSVESMKQEVKGMRDEMVELVQSEKDPAVASHADEVKAVVQKAHESIKEARVAMNDEIKNAADHAARKKAVEDFMSKLRTTIGTLREDLKGIIHG